MSTIGYAGITYYTLLVHTTHAERGTSEVQARISPWGCQEYKRQLPLAFTFLCLVFVPKSDRPYFGTSPGSDLSL